jgi:hypothetical protein
MTTLPGSVIGGRYRCTATTFTWILHGKVVDTEARLSTKPWPPRGLDRTRR